MNIINVAELRRDLFKILIDMGINPAFKENPAYASIISEIDSFISTMNLNEKANDLSLNVSADRISFECKIHDIEYEFAIFLDPISKNHFGCRKIEKQITKIFIKN